ncbi:hypothetical protein LIER_13304 [Lithospermum erythrorhizon]|uniref:RNase H type-1 domain-containing protein n=1 Tax=Lithospermum erythrorhizon TaxID=34254 RepID=A0AAV3PZ39_LITER
MLTIDTSIVLHKQHVDSMYLPIGQNMEIYVDDMLVKRKVRADQLKNLRKTFDQLRKSKLRINPGKCSFGITSEKFLELSEFDISYVSCTSIKAQVLADFIIECTIQPPQIISGSSDFELGTNNPEWILFVDGARNENGPGTGILICGPDNIIMEYALQFTFPTTNSEVEYEAMVAGLTIVKSLGINRILVKGYSKLIMYQVKGACGVKHMPLVKYHVRAIQLAIEFEQIIFEHIPHAQNEEDDHLSRLATTYYDEVAQGVYVEIHEASTYQEAIALPVWKSLRIGEPP